MDSFEYVKRKIARISRTFERDPDILRFDVKIADTVESAHIYRICYCQDFIEMRENYNQGVYDNGLIRRRQNR